MNRNTLAHLKATTLTDVMRNYGSAFGKQCQVGDRVRVHVRGWNGNDTDHGDGSVVQVTEGINRICLIEFAGGVRKQIGYRHISQATGYAS